MPDDSLQNNAPSVPPGFIPPKETDDMKMPAAKPVIQARVMPTSAEEAAQAKTSAQPTLSPLADIEIGYAPKPVADSIAPKPLPPAAHLEVELPRGGPTPTSAGVDQYREIPEVAKPQEPLAPTMPPVSIPQAPLPDGPSIPPKPVPISPLQAAVDATQTTVDPSVRRSAIRTLQGDIAETVQTRNVSVADMAIAGQRRADAARGFTPEPVDNTGKWWILGTGLFIIFGLATVVGIFYFAPEEELPVVEGPTEALVSADDRTILDVAGMTFESFTNTVRAQFLTTGAPSSIRTISLVRVISEESVSHITTEGFFTLLNSRAPARLIRSLDDSFAFGTLTATGTPSAFLLFKTNSFENAFAGMLEWETFIANDLPFIAYAPTPAVASPLPVETATSTATTTTETATTTSAGTATTTDGTASTTSASTTPPAPAIIEPLPEATFTDIVVKNEDARALTYPDGTIRLLYSFPDRETLIIAQSKEALSLLIDRLNTARFSR